VEAISLIDQYSAEIAKKRESQAEDEEKASRDSIEEELKAQKKSIEDQYELQKKALEDRIKLLEEETDAYKEAMDERTSNASLMQETYKILADGLTDEWIKKLQEYENEYGEGLGILGQYVHDNLTKEMEASSLALQNINDNLEILSKSESLLQLFSMIFGLTDMEKIELVDKENLAEALTAAASIISELEGIDMTDALEKIESALSEVEIELLNEEDLLALTTTIDDVKTQQIENSNEVIMQYGTETTEFDNMQTSKDNRTTQFVNDTKTKADDLYAFVYDKLKLFETSYKMTIDTVNSYTDTFISKLQQAIDYLDTLITMASEISGVSLTVTHATADGVTVQRFATGGKVVGTGLVMAEDKERILSVRQTTAFEKLVDVADSVFGNNRLSSAISPVDNILNNNTSSIVDSSNRTGDVEVNVNVASVTKESLPQFQQMINNLERRIPDIVANSKFQGASLKGYNKTR